MLWNDNNSYHETLSDSLVDILKCQPSGYSFAGYSSDNKDKASIHPNWIIKKCTRVNLKITQQIHILEYVHTKYLNQYSLWDVWKMIPKVLPLIT